MNGKTWYIFVWDDPELGYYVHGFAIPNCENIPDAVEQLRPKNGRLVSMNAVRTKKELDNIVETWRKAYKQNGLAKW